MYVSLCVIISIFGILAWVLIAFKFTSPEQWMINIGDLTTGGIPDRGYFYQTAPYYLGLVQILEGGGKGGFTLFNIPLFLPRLSGISAESQYAALLITPSLFCVTKVNFQKNYERLFFILLLLFIIFTLSITTYVITAVLILL